MEELTTFGGVGVDRSAAGNFAREYLRGDARADAGVGGFSSDTLAAPAVSSRFYGVDLVGGTGKTDADTAGLDSKAAVYLDVGPSDVFRTGRSEK